MSHLHKRDLGRSRMGKELQNIINHGNKLMNTGPLIQDHYCFLVKPKNMGGFFGFYNKVSNMSSFVSEGP